MVKKKFSEDDNFDLLDLKLIKRKSLKKCDDLQSKKLIKKSEKIKF
jgi:hypothetical protein